MRILHIADLHLRGITRHDEIRIVVQDLCEKASKLAIDRIVVAGDLFHTKLSGMTGEYIDLMRWMLESYAEIAPTDIILGNHDFAQNNLTRQDAVSPIVATMNNSRIKLYKQSESIPWVDGFTLSIYSLFDVEGYKNVKINPENINIALYHGCVRGATTDEDWELDGECDLSFFEGYDFVLLGDIHKFQYLGFRSTINNEQKPWIGYPGSLLQNNFGEALDHGFLVWDIRSKNDWDVNWHKLVNPKPFVTLDWNNDIYHLLDNAEKFPKNSRFRIKSPQPLMQKEIRGITSVLQKKRKAAEVVFKNDKNVSIAATGFKNVSSVLDLHSSETLLRLMKEHADNNGESFSEIEIEQLKSRLSQYISCIPNLDGIVRNTKWSVDKIEFDNLFCYGENNFIDFTKLEGIVGVFGPNRIGKSSILGTLLYTLFNTTDRGSVKNLNICNERKQHCFSKLNFSTAGDRFLIERITAKQENKKGVVYAPTNLNFFKFNENSEKIDLCGEQRTDTEKNIKSIIGNHEDFLLTTIATQGEINQFIKFGSTQRRKTLSRFLDLDFFEKIYDLANKDKNAYESQLKLCRVIDDWDLEAERLKGRVDNFLSWIDDNEQLLSALRTKLSIKNSRVDVLKTLKIVTQEDVELQQKKFEAEQKRVDFLQKRQITFENQIQDNIKEINQLDQHILQEIQIKELQKQVDNVTKLHSEFSKNSIELDKHQTKLGSVKKSLKLLDEVPCGDLFSDCKFIRDAHANKPVAIEVQNKIDTILASMSEISKSLESLKNDDAEAKLKTNNQIIQKRNELINKNKDLEIENRGILATLPTQRNEAQEAKIKLEELQEKKQQIESAELEKLLVEISELTVELKRIEKDKMASAQSLGKIHGEIEKLKADRELYENLSAKLHFSELIARSFSRKGIPNDIIKTKLPELNVEIGRILNNIVDFSIELENDDATDSLEIYINYGDSRRLIELGSGMEKTICSIATRAALVNISTLPKTDMFVLDESFDALDPASIESCNRLLRSLKEHFRLIIVISHLDGIKDAVDFSLDIIHDGKDAKIVYA